MSTEPIRPIDALTQEALDAAADLLFDFSFLESPLKELHHRAWIENQRPSSALREKMATALVHIDQALKDCWRLLNEIAAGDQS